MAALTPAIFLCVVTSWISAVGSGDSQKETAKLTHVATLQCRGPRDVSITLAVWQRTDLESDQYVFLFRDDQPGESFQQSFVGRVELNDLAMKDGHASVILKNSTANDTETYKCQVSAASRGHRERVRYSTKLTVTDPEPKEVTAKPGEDVPLQCRGPRGAAIRLIEWKRTDPKPEKYVFFLTEDKINGEYQDEGFRGRVELRDQEMKDGDASVVLKNVNINDAGTYECRVSAAGRGRRRRAAEPTSTIRLTVTDPGLTAGQEGGDKEGGNKEGGDEEGGDEEGGNLHGHFGLSASLTVVGLVVTVFGLFMFRKYKRLKKNPEQPAADEWKQGSERETQSTQQ